MAHPSIDSVAVGLLFDVDNGTDIAGLEQAVANAVQSLVCESSIRLVNTVMHPDSTVIFFDQED